MELIYSTGALADAQHLSGLLTAAGLHNHVSGANSAQLPGFVAERSPSFVGVWLTNTSELVQARSIMLRAGYLQQPANCPPSAAWVNTSWFKAVIAILVAAAVAFAALSGP